MTENDEVVRTRSSRYQIGIATVLLLMIPIGYGFLRLSDYLDNRPVVWDTYTQAHLDRELADGNTVVFFLDGSWQGPGPQLKDVFDLREVKRLSRSPNISMMTGQYGGVRIPRHSSGSYGSMISIFHPATPTKPVGFVGYLEDSIVDGVIAEMRAASKRK